MPGTVRWLQIKKAAKTSGGLAGLRAVVPSLRLLRNGRRCLSGMRALYSTAVYGRRDIVIGLARSHARILVGGARDHNWIDLSVRTTTGCAAEEVVSEHIGRRGCRPT